MSRRRRDPTQRLSRAYFPPPPDREPGLPAEGSGFFFARDLPLGLMPFRGSNENSAFSISLDPPDTAREVWLAELLEVRDRYSYGVEDAVTSFVEETIGFIAYFGERYFEIASVEPEADELPPVRLLPLPWGPVVQLVRSYYQLIPRHARSEDGKRMVRLPASRIWHLRLPRELGSPRRHRRMLRRLSRVSRPVPDFAFPTGGLAPEVRGYDFTTYHRLSDIAVERLTNRWGTIPSLNQVEGTTEYFFVARRLRFLRSQALIRGHILRELNALLERLGVPERIVMTGLPTPQAIDETLGRLERGEIGFKEALDTTRV